MKPISLDLRQRIVEAYKRDQGSQRALAQRFSLSRSTVERLLKRERLTGSVAPKPHGGGRTAILQQHDRETIRAWLLDDPDLIQQEIAERFTEETGHTVSQQTISRSLRPLEITRKKSP